MVFFFILIFTFFLSILDLGLAVKIAGSLNFLFVEENLASRLVQAMLPPPVCASHLRIPHSYNLGQLMVQHCVLHHTWCSAAQCERQRCVMKTQLLVFGVGKEVD